MPTRLAISLAVFLVVKLFFIFYSLWAIVPAKYIVLINVLLLPIKYWSVTLPILLFVVTVFTLSPTIYSYLMPNSDGSVRNGRGGSHLLLIPSQSRECICVNKNKCYKGYYDDMYIECVSRSLPTLNHLSMWYVWRNFLWK